MEVPAVAKQATAEKRPRRERGSINPDDIISGAFELAEQVSIDNLSMPLLGKHLGVGVTSIYWYFRKKDDLLNAMTDRALTKYVFATPYVEASDWRETLGNHARSMRKTFMGNPILCDLILIRSALSPRAARLGAQQIEKAIAGLVEAGLSPEEAFETYSAVTVHVRGSVVLQRLQEKNQATEDGRRTIEDAMVIDADATPLLAQMTAKGHHIGAADDDNFQYGLDCILDRARMLIEEVDASSATQVIVDGTVQEPTAVNASGSTRRRARPHHVRRDGRSAEPPPRPSAPTWRYGRTHCRVSSTLPAPGDGL
jgi:AcrR family transcriptional regulator